jgi:hypothetical protein
MTTTQATGALKNFLPNEDCILGAFSLTSYISMVQKFVDQIGQSVTPNVPIVSGISAAAVTAIQNVNTAVQTHFTQIKKDAGDDQMVIAQLRTVLGGLENCVSHSILGIRFIYNEATSGSAVNNSKVEDYLNFILRQYTAQQHSIGLIGSADYATSLSAQLNNIHTRLENDIGDLNTDLTNLQNSISPSDGAKLNFSTLTSTQAMSILQGRVDDLQSEASTLQKQIAWETAGQVAIGIVGGIIAITNYWNPIGWAAAAGTVAGEIELAKDKVSKQLKLANDQQNIALEQQEEDFIGPYYMMVQYQNQMQQLAAGLEQLQKGLTNIITYISDAVQDIPGFISDLGDPSSLELDYEAVIGDANNPGDLMELKSALQALMNFPANTMTSDAPITSVPMSTQSAWDAALNNPDSPYYVPIIATAANA